MTLQATDSDDNTDSVSITVTVTDSGETSTVTIQGLANETTPENAIFNPASNLDQVSHLRLVNPGTEVAEVTITGIDDAGAAPGTAVEVEVRAGGSVMLTAADLETGAGLVGALGDGPGKCGLRWRPTGPFGR